MARYTRARRAPSRGRRAAPRRSYGSRRVSYAAPRRRTARRTTSRRRVASTQTVRLVIDTGSHSGASLGPDGMAKPAPKPRNGRFA